MQYSSFLTIILFLSITFLFDRANSSDCAHSSRYTKQEGCDAYTGCAWNSLIARCQCSENTPNDIILIFDETGKTARDFMSKYLPTLTNTNSTRYAIIESDNTNGFKLSFPLDYYSADALRDNLKAGSSSSNTPKIYEALDIMLAEFASKQQTGRKRVVMRWTNGHESWVPEYPESYYDVCHNYADKVHGAVDKFMNLRYGNYYYDRALNCLTHSSGKDTYHFINLKFWAQFAFWWFQFPLCPVNDIKVSEFKGVYDANNKNQPRFVEFYNNGNDLYLKDFVFSGNLVESVMENSVNTLHRIAEGSYFVFYNGDISCENCGCSKQSEEGKTKWCNNVMYIECCDSDNVSGLDAHGNKCICKFNNNANVNAYEEQFTIKISRMNNGALQDVNTFNFNKNTFPAASAGQFSAYEVADVKDSNNNNLANWRSNCDQNGSPGDSAQISKACPQALLL